MNEMIELSRLWAEEPVASERELAASRALLMTAIQAPPVKASPSPAGNGTLWRRGWRQYGPRAGMAGGLAAAMTGIVIAVQVGLGGSAGSGGVPGLVAAPPANAQELLKLAAQAAVKTELHASPGQYLHTRIRNGGGVNPQRA
jgi:hypothetical protein